LRILKSPPIGTKAGATSSRKQISEREQIPLKLPSIAKLNWKGENRKLYGRQRLRTLHQIVSDETGFLGTLAATTLR